jgi:23S rRNA (uracil1939-C5)-methyltransferase
VISLPVADTTAPCPHFPACGGCTIQDRLLGTQADYKQAWLSELITPLMKGKSLLPLISAGPEESFWFRGKIRYGFLETEGGIVASRHGEGNGVAEVPIRTCLLQSELSVQLARETAEFGTSHGWKVFNPLTHQGSLKHLLVREGKHTGECLISLVTTEVPIPHLSEWVAMITSRFPTVTAIFQTRTQGRNNERSDDIHLWGAHWIHERVGEYLFAISPHSFFQTNASLVERLYTTIRDLAELTGTEVVWDLYAGSATIGIFLSQHAAKVLSIESNLQNIYDAEQNRELNTISNLTIVSGLVESVITSHFIHTHGAPNVLVVDPPRAGLSEKIRRLLPHIGAQRIIYTSCNPLTFRRDALEIIQAGYQLDCVQGIDMFPHTLHCELVAQFRILGT